MQLSDTAFTAQMAVPSLAYAFPHALAVKEAQYETEDAVVATVLLPLPELLSVSESSESFESVSLSSPESLESVSESPLSSSESVSSESPLVLCRCQSCC